MNDLSHRSLFGFASVVCMTIFATSLPPAAYGADQLTPAEALALSEKTGRPILAVASSDTCPICERLLNRLSTDRKLQPLLGNYIPLNVVSGKENSFGEWRNKFPTEGNGVPIVYVIRSDGEAIYAKSGGLSGNALPTLLTESIQKCGKPLDEKSSLALSEGSEKLAKAFEAKDMEAVSVELPGFVKVFKQAGMHSYAKPAVDAKALLTNLVETNTTELEALKNKLTEMPDDWESLKKVAEIKRMFGVLPPLKKPIGDVVALARRNKESKVLFAIALKLDNVHTILAKHPEAPQGAISELEKIAALYPDSPAASDAAEWIKKLQESAPSLEESPASP